MHLYYKIMAMNESIKITGSAYGNPFRLLKDLLLLLQTDSQLLRRSLVLLVIRPHAKEIVDFDHSLANVGHSVDPSRYRLMQQSLSKAIGKSITILPDNMIRIPRKLLLNIVQHSKYLPILNCGNPK